MRMKATSSGPLVRRYLTGRDLARRMREQYVIDTFGIDGPTLRSAYPDAFQWVVDHVKPERDQNPRETYRINWWKHAEPRSKFRSALVGLSRFIVTSRTARHRTFEFIDAAVLPETKVLIIALEVGFQLAVLQSSVHVLFSTRLGGWLGVGNDSTYNHSICFDTFPFPNLADQPALAAQIAATAEELDAHRKRQQAAHASLTLTDMYNVLDALRLRRALTAKERRTHADGLVSVLAELHDSLDALVLQAYGWSDLAPALVGQPGGTLPWPGKPAAQAAAEEELLLRLVALNAERAAEEARGTVRWLRPEFQDPARRGAAALPVATQDEMDLGVAPATVAAKGRRAAAAAAPAKRPWPNTLPEQMRGVTGLLTASARPVALAAIESAFTGRGPWKRRLPQILEALAALGRARQVNGLWTLG
ncbi:MAG: type IIL restriction-modification enzyme MmeI [Burkholderiaceae bacterium]